MPLCKVANCRYPHTHTTVSHQCGICGKFGHGQMECGNKTKISQLRNFYYEILPENKWCTLCSDHNRHRKSHTSQAHICSKCGKRHSERDCIIQDFDHYNSQFGDMPDLAHFSTQKMLEAEDNIYTILYSGMGSHLYVRKRSNEIQCLFMHQDSWGQYGIDTDNRPILTKFILNLTEIGKVNFFDEPEQEPNSDKVLFECPICRTSNSSDKIIRAYGLEDKCKICLEAPVTRFFGECGHAVACEQCFQNL